jgi:amidase
MTDDDIAWMSIDELARRIRARELTSVEATEAMLRRIAALDPALRAYARVTPELARAQARAADARLARGEPAGPLHGVPIAVKDLCWTAGIPTAAGTTIHRDFVPPVDGTVVRRLREAGAVLLGKLQMTEGAFSAHHPAIDPPRNPWNPDTWTGVSSSGSGVAAAAALCFGAIGTDTGGSIRYPSAANGVTGLKPTWGRVSRHGAFELAASLDHIGPMARSAADCGLMLAAIAGADPDDPTALQAPVPDFLAGDGRRLDGITVGLDEAWALGDIEAPAATALADALRVLAGAGARVLPVRMPAVDAVVAGWVAHCGVEAAVAHAATYPSRRAEYGPMLAGLLDTGLALSGPDYQRILLARAGFTGQVDALMAEVDLLITPVMPFAGPSVARIATLRNEPGYRLRLSRYTAPFDMSGHPTITLPAGFTADDLPVAVQLVSGRLREDLLVRAGRVFQAITDWHARRPPVLQSVKQARGD